MADEPEPKRDEYEDDDELVNPLTRAAGKALTEVATGIKVLRVVALVAVLLWLFAAATTFIGMRDQYGVVPSDGMLQFMEPGSRWAMVISATLSAGTQYLLVAVLAYAASLGLQSRRLRELMEELDEAFED